MTNALPLAQACARQRDSARSQRGQTFLQGNVMRKLKSLIASAAVAFSPTIAAADGAGAPRVFMQIRTVQGCLIYWARPATSTEAQILQLGPWNFEGTGCEPGRVLTGEGRLSNPNFGVRGRIVNGVLEGEVQDDMGGRITGTTIYQGGCARWWIEERICRPFSGMPATRAGQVVSEEPAVSPSGGGAPPGGGGTSVAATNADVFEQCVSREGPQRSGIEVLYYLRNVCRQRISLSFCLEADFEAAGDYNLCSRREHRTHSVAPGEAVHFSFSLMPPGTALSDGRVVTQNSLYVRGHACANDATPQVHFEGRTFALRGC